MLVFMFTVFIEIPVFNANSVDPNQMLQNLTSDLTLFANVLFSSPEHEVLMVSYCGQSVVRRGASTIALKAYSSYTPGPIDSILGRKHQGDL